MRMKPGGWSLDRAAKENREDIACALIDRGADIEAKDILGRTPRQVVTSTNSDVFYVLKDHIKSVRAGRVDPMDGPISTLDYKRRGSSTQKLIPWPE